MHGPEAAGCGIPHRNELISPRLRDRLLEHVVADRALEDPVADHEGRRAAGADRPGELDVAIELGAALGGRLGRLHARVALRLRDHRLGRPAEREHPVVELAEAALARRGEADMRRRLAARAEHRQLAPDHLEARIFAEQPLHVRIRGPAIAAGIIEELDQDDVAVGGARPGAVIGRLKRGALLADRGRRLALLHPLHRLGQDLAMIEDIVADDLFGRGAVGGAKAVKGRHSERADQQAGKSGDEARFPAARAPRKRHLAVPPPPLLDRASRDHGDVLRAQPIGRADLDAHQRPLGIGQSELGLALEVVALGGGERRPGLVALAVVDDAELVPGEGIVVVARDGEPKHPFRFLEIGRVLGRDQSVAEQGGDQRLIGDQSHRLPQRLERLARMARFEQHLALELEEIGIARPGREQGVDLRRRLLRVGGAVIGESARIAGGDGGVARGIAGQHPARLLDEAEQLGADALEALLERRLGRPRPGRVGLVDILQPRDSLGVQRVGARVAVVLRDGEPELLVLEAAEESERAAAADPRVAQIGGAGLVGAVLLDSAEGEEAAHRRLLAGGEHAHAGLARAGRHRRRAEDQRQDHDPGRLLNAFVHSDDMAAGDVAELVRDHALDLVGIVGGGDQARMQIDDLAAGDEGVDLLIVDEDDAHVLGLKPGRLDQRPRHLAQQHLGLGVAQDRLRRRRLGQRREAQGDQHRQPDQEGPAPAGR